MAKIGIFKKISSLFGGTSEEPSTTEESLTNPEAPIVTTPPIATESEVVTPKFVPEAPAATPTSAATPTLAATSTLAATPSPVVTPAPIQAATQSEPIPGPKYVSPPARPTSDFKSEPVPEEVHLTIEQITINEGPTVKIVIRGGAQTYAVCPKCEAMWNLKDRLTVIMHKRLDKSLTCVACNEIVSLPATLDLRKI